MGRLTILMLATMFVPGVAWSQETRQPLPVIRQVWLDAEDAPTVLGTGTWSMVPRREFVKVLEAAEKVSLAEKRMPWLLQAQYDARIEGLQMAGTAELLMHNPHEKAAWAQLAPWTMPLRSEGVVSDKLSRRDIRSLTERSVGLLIGSTRSQSYRLNWSVQGEGRSDGRWFQMQLPACPQATMNIAVPFPYRLDWPSARQHLRGPFPIEGSDARRWQLQLGGEVRQDVQLVLRAPFEQKQVSWMEARLEGDFFVNGQEVQARYEIDVQRWHDRLRSLILDLPEQLLIKSVSLRQLGADTPLSNQRLSATSMTVQLPESVEQRATIVLEGSWKRRRGERIVFQTPGLRDSVSVRPTLRIVAMPSEPLVDWNWGDYVPQQLSTQERTLESAVEVLTLLPRLMVGTTTLAPPSARQVERSLALAYQQDTWWRLGKRTQQLMVRCQTSVSQGQSEFLSWQVPAGWTVRDVISDSTAPIQAWTWHTGRPLEVHWPAGRKPGQRAVTVQLEPSTPLIITEEPRVWFMPNLIPLVPGRFAGSYAISLERVGDMLPPSMVVIKSPGMRTSAPSTPLGQWFPAGMPDLYWQIQDAGATGSVQIQDWPATARTSLETRITESERASHLNYSIKLQPIAGNVTNWPVVFAANQEDVVWAPVPMLSGWNWRQRSPTAGLLAWSDPLDHTVTWSARVPWTPGTPVPLLGSSMPFDGRLKLGRFVKMPSVWKGERQEVNQGEQGTAYRYDAKTLALTIERAVTDRLELMSPRIDTTVNGSVAESAYSTTLSAHGESVQFSVPPNCEIISCELDGKSLSAKNPIVLPAALEPARLQVKYRSVVQDRSWGSNWHQPIPVWSMEATPSPVCHVTHAQHRIPLSGVAAKTGTLEGGNSYVTSGDGSIVWISRQMILVSNLLVFGLCWWLVRCRASFGIMAVVAMIALVLVHCLFSQGVMYSWWIALAAILGAGGSWFRNYGSWRTRTAVVAACLLVLYGNCLSVMAQAERISLVYILRGNADKDDDERVIVPASLWQQIQAMAKQTTVGGSQRWWASEVTTEGQMQNGRLRFFSKWIVSTSHDDIVDIPWLESKPPEKLTIDGAVVEPRLVNGPFGLQQWGIPIRQAGLHEMTVTWELPIKQEGAMQSVEIKAPGAPYQRLILKNLPEKLYVQGTAGAWQIKQQDGVQTLSADTGMSRSIVLSWLLKNAPPADVVVDTGVLWEHRVHQSIAHAVLAYHIEQGMLDQFTIELPVGLRVRNLSIVGDVHAVVSPRISQWRIEQVNGKQRLQVFLQRPVAGIVHLLLEMPWQRDPRTNNVPLEQLHLLGVKQRHAIVAFMADGVQVQPLATMESASSEEIEFARPWLPSLGSLRASAITRAVQNDAQVPLLRLLPLETSPLLKTENSMVLEPQGIQHRFAVEADGQQRPLVYLNGHVDPGLVISEVAGSRVARWFQTPARPSEPSQLSVWFSAGTTSSPSASFTVIARQAMEILEEQRLQLPVYQIKWDGASEGPTLLRLLNSRSGKISSLSASNSLRCIAGPWNTFEQIAAYELQPSIPAGTTLSLQEENTQQLPKATAAWDNTSGEPRWVLTMTAPSGGVLPTQMDMLSLNGHLEQQWQFEAGTPLAFRPSRSLGSAILWSIQFSKPVSRMQIKCYPIRDAQGKMIPPVVSFPTWSGMAITSVE